MDVPGTEEAADSGAGTEPAGSGVDGGSSEGDAPAAGPENSDGQRRRLLDGRKQHRLRRHRR